MTRTASENDHEALASLRAANAIIAKTPGLTWERVLNHTVQVINEVEQAPEDYNAEPTSRAKLDADAVNRAFEVLLATVPREADFRRFVDEMHELWEKNGTLTSGQADAILRSAQRNAR
jgi:hypothetical protein